MNKEFQKLIDVLDPSYRRLIGMEPTNRNPQLPRDMPKAGIYLFSEAGQHLYVGRSNSLKDRIYNHSRPSSGHIAATFAFRIARKKMGVEKATYTTKGSRAELQADPDFRKAFDQAKEKVRNMEVRFVEEQEPLEQALLEMYVAVALDTPYNDFDNH